MKKISSVLVAVLLFLLCFSYVGCDFLGGDGDGSYTESYDAITGKFVLYESADKRFTYTDTYFDIDGSEGNFSVRYFENGVLKKQGQFKKIVTRVERIGKWCDNLHFNIKCGDEYIHVSTYTESFEPINQFRILQEYDGDTDENYYLSELPFPIGVYVREGANFVAESKHTNSDDYMTPTLDNFTSAIDGYYKLDDEHYFYFLSPKGWETPNGFFLDSYYQYYAPNLQKPIEGFVKGYTYENNTRLLFKTLKDGVDWGNGSEGRINFGYFTVDENDNMREHFGTVDFSNGVLNSFTFEHLSRHWTENELNEWEQNENYRLPDPILYDYKGGTYTKIE